MMLDQQVRPDQRVFFPWGLTTRQSVWTMIWVGWDKRESSRGADLHAGKTK